MYINMFLYLFQYFSVLSFFLHMIILCLSSFSKNCLLSFFLESLVMLCMYTLYLKRSTLYKFIEINTVLFCSVYYICRVHWAYFKHKSWWADIEVKAWYQWCEMPDMWLFNSKTEEVIMNLNTNHKITITIFHP